MTTYRKKLIEVALPLDAINKESAREKSIRHGHPSTLHLWWARRPLAACRAVLFSSLVNDPDDDPMYGISEDTAATERAKLFDLIEELVKWENSNNPRVINAARLEIARSIAANKVADKELKDDTPLVANAPQLPEEQAKYLPEPPLEYTPHDVRFKMPSLRPEQVNHFLAHYAPPVLDPFAGGGSNPLEAQRLGLRAYASDLNPVPVLINKALIEIPPKFAGMPPVNPKWQKKGKSAKAAKVWRGAEGLADDVRYYGQWMREEAEKRIGHLYPKVKITEKMADDRPDLKPYVGKELTVIAWLWARTVKSPNPANKEAHVPLIGSYWLCKKSGKETYIEPQIDHSNNSITFEVRVGPPKNGFCPDEGTKSGRATFACALSGTVITGDYIDEEANSGRMSYQPLAIVAEGQRERVFLPVQVHVWNTFLTCEVDDEAIPNEPARGTFAGNAQGRVYGFKTFGDYFTRRQKAALLSLVDIVAGDLRAKVRHDSSSSDRDADAYAKAVCLYLAFCINKASESLTSLCTWSPLPTKLHVVSTFGRQAIPMVWDFAESNPFAESSGNFGRMPELVAKVLQELPCAACVTGDVQQADARKLQHKGESVFVTDPPYYDNIGYADLSDFFYVWFRRSIQQVYPELFSTLLTPKTSELIATPYRHDGSMSAAKEFFESGLQEAITRMQECTSDDTPVSIFYAFKQTESETTQSGTSVSSTGWETMLQAVISCGFNITGTWPVRTERAGGFRNNNQNALASSIVLVCRRRDIDASLVTRRDFANALRQELPDAINHLQSGNVAPVDLAQASIGPGMAVFSRYQQVVNADGSPMSVREALQMINQVLDESLSEQEADFDSETRFAVRWFEQYGESDGPFGDAETLAKAMAVAVSGVVEAGILASKGGKVRLLKRDQLDGNWNPATDKRSTVWECTQHLIRRLEEDGESAAAQLLADIQQAKGSEAGEVARELSYRLYSTCERKSRAAEARSYNGLVVSWPEIQKLARQAPRRQGQTELFS